MRNPEFFEGEITPKAKIKLNLTTAELLGKYYHPKGNEYEYYLKSK